MTAHSKVADSQDLAPVQLVSRSRLADALVAIRPKQWTKNLIVFVGLVFALRLTDPGSVLYAIGGFVVFCLLSSAGYLVNDVLDIEADRQHPRKCLRPIARGSISVRTALALAVVLAAVAMALAIRLKPTFALIAASYLLLTL